MKKLWVKVIFMSMLITMIGGLFPKQNLATVTSNESAGVTNVYQNEAPIIESVELSSTFTSSNEIKVYLKANRDDVQNVVISGWSGGAYEKYATSQEATYDEIENTYVSTFQLNSIVNTTTNQVETASEIVYSFDAIVYGTNNTMSYARLEDVQYTQTGFTVETATNGKDETIVNVTAEEDGYIAILKDDEEITEETTWQEATVGANAYSLATSTGDEKDTTTEYKIMYKAGEEVSTTSSTPTAQTFSITPRAGADVPIVSPYTVGSTDYSTLSAAYAAISSASGTITMNKNVSDSTEFTVKNGKTITLNTNGFTLTRTKTNTVESGGTLHITGTGKITTAITDAHLFYNYGTMTLTDATLEHTADINWTSCVYNMPAGVFTMNSGAMLGVRKASQQFGTFNMSGGTVKVTNTAGNTTATHAFSEWGYNDPIFNITGGEIIAINDGGEAAAIVAGSRAPKINLSNVKITSEGTDTYGVWVYGATASEGDDGTGGRVTITGDTTITSTATNGQGRGVYVYLSDMIDAGFKITMDSGSITATGTSTTYGIRYQGSSSNVPTGTYVDEENVVISGGTITAGGTGTAYGLGAYRPTGKIIVNGGTIKSNYSGIMHHWSGKLIIGTEGGEVSRTAPEIQGTTQGIHIAGSQLYFYDGISKGETTPILYEESPDAIVENGYEIVNGTATIDSTAYTTAYLKLPSTFEVTPTSGNAICNDTNSFVVTSSIPGTITVTSSNTSYVTVTEGNGATLIADGTGNYKTTVAYKGVSVTSNPTALTVTFIPADSEKYETIVSTYNVKAVAYGETLLMRRESALYDSSSYTYTYYMIGAKRAGLTEYTADLVKTITILSSNEVPADVISWDASYTSGDGTVMAWIEPTAEDPTKYDLYIGGNGTIKAPTDSDRQFAGYSNCTTITGLENLEITGVESLYCFFYDCDALENVSDLRNWDVSSVTNMGFLFSGCAYLKNVDLTNWHTTSLKDTCCMFQSCGSLTSVGDISGWDVSNATDMSSMFAFCNELTTIGDISKWNTNSLTDTSKMFNYCQALTSLNLSGWNTSLVTNMDRMFSSCINLKSVMLGDNFNKLIGQYMFSSDSSLTAIITTRDIDVSGDAITLSGDIGLNSLSKAVLYVPDEASEKAYEEAIDYTTNFGAKNASGDIVRIKPILSLSGDSPINVRVNYTYTEANDPGVTVAGFDKNSSGEYTKYGYNLTTVGLPVDTSTVNTSKTITYTLTYGKTNPETVMTLTRTVNIANKILMKETYDTAYTNNYILGNATVGVGREAVKTIKFIDTTQIAEPTTYKDKWDVSRDKNGMVTAWLVVNSSDTTKYDLYIGAEESIDVVDFTDFFANYTNCISITGFENVNTSLCSSLISTFNNCRCLESINISTLNTSNVTNMYNLFGGCSNLKGVTFGNIDTSKVDSFALMFNGCSKLESGDLSSFNTSSATTIEFMFNGCSSLQTINLSTFNTAKVKKMNYLFAGCSNLQSITFGNNFVTTEVLEMPSMFENCSKLTNVDLSKFNTAKVTNMRALFLGCSGLTTLNVSKLDTSKVTNMDYMFQNCTSLTSLDVSTFKTSEALTMNSMFENCTGLTKLDLTNFDTQKVTGNRAMFFNCSNLNSVVLGKNFSALNSELIFGNCSNLKAVITQKAITNSANAIPLSATVGLESFADAILYVPNEASETAYEGGANYSTVLGAERIEPILAVSGDNPYNTKLLKTYIDPGATVAGFAESASGEYSKYGYTLTTTGLPIDTKTPGTKQVTYTLTYKNPKPLSGETATTETLMRLTRTVNVADAVLTIMQRESYASSETQLIIGAKRAGLTYAASSVKTITLLASNKVPDDAIASWDVSYTSGDEYVMAWIKESSADSSMYDLYIGGYGGIVAPSNILNLFAWYTKCTEITGLGILDTSNVTNFSYIFNHMESITQIDVSGFNTVKATYMEGVFNECHNLESVNISTFNTTKVTSFYGMFYKAQKLKVIDLSNIAISSTANTTRMFYLDTSLELIILGKNVNNLTGSGAFYGTSKLKAVVAQKAISLSGDAMALGTTTNMPSSAILYVPNETSETAYEGATNYSSVFGANRIVPILGVSGDNPARVKLSGTYVDEGATVAGFDELDMTKYGYTVVESGLPVDTKTVETKTVTYTLKYKDPDDASSTEETLMTITRDVKILGVPVIMTREGGSYDAATSTNTYMIIGSKRAMLNYSADSVKTITLVNTSVVPNDAVASWDASYDLGDKQVMVWIKENSLSGDMQMYDVYIGADQTITAPAISTNLFGYYPNCTEINSLNLLNIENVEKADFMFARNQSLLKLDLNSFNTNKVTDMYAMFYVCKSLQELKIENFNTAEVTNMGYMFADCLALAEIDVDGFNTEKVTNMGYMFANCDAAIEIPVGGFKTPELTNMDHMFWSCYKLTSIDLSSFDTSGVESMRAMFMYNRQLKSINLTNVDTSANKDFNAMFYECNALETLDLSGFNTSAATDMINMFNGATSLKKLDLSSFDTRQNPQMENLITNNTALESVLLGNNFTNINGSGMFENCGALTALITTIAANDVSGVPTLSTDTSLDTQTNIILYVPDEASETAYEDVASYATEFGAKNASGDIERIKPILSISGDNPIIIGIDDTFVDPGVSVAGFGDVEGYEYYDYVVTSTNNIDTKVQDDYEVVYTLSRPAGTKVMSVKRTVSVRDVPTLPTITVKQGSSVVANGDWASGEVNITIGGSTFYNGELDYQYSFDSQTWQTGSTLTYNTETESQMLYAKAVEITGSNMESEVASFEIKIDKTAPTIISAETVTYSTVYEVVEVVTNDSTISSGIAKYGISGTNSIGTATWYTAERVTVPDNGTWYLWVIDNAGNASESFEITTTERRIVEAKYSGKTAYYRDTYSAFTELETLGITTATIKLLDNDESDIEIINAASQNNILDLNGKILRISGTARLRNVGTLKVINSASDEGTITSAGTQTDMIINEGKITIDGNLKMVSELNGDVVRKVIGGRAAGTINIENGTLINETTAYAIYSEGSLNITGGTITSAIGRGLNLPSGTVNISGDVTIETETTAVDVASGVSVTIKGATITTNSSQTIYNEGTVVIESGTITSISGGQTINNKATGILTIGIEDGSVSTETPRIVSEADVGVNNAGTFNFYDGRIVSVDIPIKGEVTDLEDEHHVEIVENAGIQEAYLVSNEEWIEYWDISKEAGVDNVYAGLKVISGDGRYGTSEYVLVIGGTGRTQDFTYYGEESSAPWYDEYAEYITELELKEGVTTYGIALLNGLTAVNVLELPNTLQEIRARAFSHMFSVSGEVSIPESVTIITQNPFIYTPINSVKVKDGNTVYKSVDGVLYNNVKKELIVYPQNKETENFVIEEGTLIINSYAAVGATKLNNVIFPDGLQAIYGGAFEMSSISGETTIPESVTSIGGYAFYGNNNLKTVYLKSSSLTLSGSSSFSGLAQGSVIYTESKAIADLFVPDTTYTSSKTTIYYPFEITTDIEDIGQKYGTTVTFAPTIEAGVPSDDVSYQWYKDGSPIDDATSASYTKANIGEDDAGDYQLVIKSAIYNGTDYYYTVNSNVATLTLIDSTGPESITYVTTYKEDGTAKVTITAKDNDTGIASIEVNGTPVDNLVEDVANKSATADVVIDAAGTYTVIATDNEDNSTTITITAYEITYDANSAIGISGATEKQIKIEGAAIKLRESGFEKVGHSFASWNTSADGNGTTYAADATYSVDANSVLYATWGLRKYTVTFYNDNGVDPEYVVSTAQYEYGTVITVPGAQQRAAIEASDSTYRIFKHYGWSGEVVDANAQYPAEDITSENHTSVVVRDSDINYYATYSYTDYDKETLAVVLEGNMTVSGTDVGIKNVEGIVIVGENSTSAKKPTISGDTAIMNDNGLILWYLGAWQGTVQGTVTQK